MSFFFLIWLSMLRYHYHYESRACIHFLFFFLLKVLEIYKEQIVVQSSVDLFKNLLTLNIIFITLLVLFLLLHYFRLHCTNFQFTVIIIARYLPNMYLLCEVHNQKKIQFLLAFLSNVFSLYCCCCCCWCYYGNDDTDDDAKLT